MYLAVAQVADGANLAHGIPRLRKAIETGRPTRPEFYFELANGYSKANRYEAAIPFYQEALRREPRYAVARQSPEEQSIYLNGFRTDAERCGVQIVRWKTARPAAVP